MVFNTYLHNRIPEVQWNVKCNDFSICYEVHLVELVKLSQHMIILDLWALQSST